MPRTYAGGQTAKKAQRLRLAQLSYTTEELALLKVPELKAIAKEYGISLPARAKKDQVIQRLVAATN